METDRKGNRDSVVWAPSRDLFIILLNGLFSFVVREPWWLWPVHHAVPYFKPPKRPLLSRCVPERGRPLMENVLTIDVFVQQQSPCKNVFISSSCNLFSCSADPKHGSSSAGPSRRQTSSFNELWRMMSSSGISISCMQSTFLEPASVHMQSRSVKLLACTLWFPADVTLDLDRHLHAGCET